MFEGLVVTGKFNAAAATLYGTQVDGLLRPLPGFDLQGSYGYLHTKYDSFDNPILGNLTGNKFAQAPEHTVHLSATYTHRTSVGEIVANASYAYISSVTFADDNLKTPGNRSEEPTSELQSLMRISYAVLCLKTNKTRQTKDKAS